MDSKKERMSFNLDAGKKNINELKCILTWLAPVTLQRTSPKIHLSMNVERGVSGTETEIVKLLGFVFCDIACTYNNNKNLTLRADSIILQATHTPPPNF